jgi:hypothetical protein
MIKTLSDSHRMLVRLLWLNIALDLLSIPIWIAFWVVAQGSITSTSTLTVDPTIAILDAAAGVALFGLALWGVLQNQKSGSYVAVMATVAQRVAGVFIFQVNVGMALEVVWTTIIVYFAYRNLQNSKSAQEQLRNKT